MPSHSPPHVYLASQSPRRRELLTAMGIPFEVMVAGVDESRIGNEPPEAYVQRLARLKAEAIAARVAGSPIIIGADTAVVIDDQLLGKPADADDAARMLRMLAGRMHRVMTAVTVRRDQQEATELSVSKVRFRAVEEAEMARYWRSGEPRDKAGGYAIQGLGASFVSHLEGSYSGVVGLPLYELSVLLRRFGLNLF